MQKKLASIFLLFTVIFLSFTTNSSYAYEKGKTIVISMNKTNLDNMENIPVLKQLLSNKGYIGLMNIRGDGGSDDKRAYATIGSGARAYISSNYNDFVTATADDLLQYKSAVGKDGSFINTLSINSLINDSESKGQYGAKLGTIGKTLVENGFKVSVLGNADTGEKTEELNRNIALMAMDSLGRISSGNIDDINIKDNTMPYGIRTDYEKLLSETIKFHKESDVLFIELGDTTRLHSYKNYLNEDTYYNMRESIYKNINNYLTKVFNLIDSNDTIYIVSPTVSTVDSKNKKRLAPVIKFEGEGKGILTSATTRRDGVIANVDIGVDILNKYNLSNNQTVGKTLNTIDKDNNLEYLEKDFEKIVSMTSMRSTVVSVFVGIIAISWMVAMVILLLKDKLPIKNKEALFKVLKEFIKLGLVIPLAFLVAPITNATTNTGITLSIIGVALIIYILGHTLFKDNDLKQMVLYSLLIITVITIDSIFGTYLMKNNIMSYDAMIGARYYGIGNEYEGITIASMIFGASALLHYNKNISKALIGAIMLVALVASAHPAMGANVGGAISESVGYLVFLLLIFDKKIDFKKIALIGLCVALVVGGFAVMDIISGSESHLSLFVNQIITNGPIAIIQTFGRKIAMNIKLAKSSVWVNILFTGIAIIAVLIFKLKKYFAKMNEKYPMLFKGFVASMIGCITTLLVNDSGIVSASTASLYILIPIIILTINSVIYKKDE